ncbi:pheromone-processing carboxypeptidase kex1 [Xylona heveae TC161]|uniref:Carboxypeptidase n=1 Tax=Xylona heveae (strain CBS 132557 / TC161) TaxID=1328760 RepID=A0A165J455_XYLHT|nr:pheromone-processing carboxypeptidase kex1 [Xylona heveae TC161]KZF25704.1 pheromone-processing carboxypeptidase kex1 [Xylona heveae TC161]
MQAYGYSTPRIALHSRAWVVLICNLLLCSFLTGSAAADKAAADYFVHDLPGAPDGPLLKMHAGHIEITPEHHGNLFFWFYQNRHIANKQRTVIWLNGGPGCSSMDGALMEIGPYRLTKDGNLTYNEGSWDEFANVLFVDQPVGTGFSYVDTDSYIHDLDEMADQFITFLEKWFSLFPDYEHDDLYIAGESYAGQYIPYIAQEILNRGKGWMLKGLLIGNGWISPVDQYLSYLPFAYNRGLVQGDSDDAKRLESQQSVCTQALNNPDGANHVDVGQCEDILQELLRVTNTHSDGGKGCINMYDIRLSDTYPSCGMNWPPDLSNVTPYLRRPEVVRALHINPDKKAGWTECSGAVSSKFRAKNSKPSIQLLPSLLEHVPIVLFSGDQDLICNHLGTEELIHNMEWNGGKGFELSPGTWAPRRHWTFEGEPAGIYQEARNLTYVLFYNSSHMVPFDYARRSRDMLDRFMGVDIASIGGVPADSRIDGEKGIETSVGGHPNSTIAEKEEEEKLQQAKWDAYYRSGEAALVVVVIAAAVWGWFVWRGRRRTAGYRGLFPDTSNGHVSEAHQGRSRTVSGLQAFKNRRQNADLEAGDFDESELDDLTAPNSHGRNEHDRERYSLGGTSSDEEDTPDAKGRGNLRKD